MGRKSAFLAVLAVLAALLALPAAASAAAPPPNSTWSQATIRNGDVSLHADVLRPKGATGKTPVILSIGPYFNHSGQTGPAGPVENASYDPVGPTSGPSDRFYDFVNGARLMQRGYTFVMVDLRGFGGSNGCLDWGGPGEQSDVVSAVRWAATQPWSSGKVGMYGKSYDALTGLIGVNKRPAGLAAVVAQEPVYDLYRYLYGDGIRRINSAATPALYNLIALSPGPLLGSQGYNVTAFEARNPGCNVQNQLDQTSDDDHASAYWRARNLIPGAKGSSVPLFLTQGLTENNTVADGLEQYMANHTGYERAWLGPWEHVRGNETCAEGDAATGCTDQNVGRLKMGRAGFFDEVMRFYDRFLKDGAKPTDPPVAVQTNDGHWRPEPAWPAADTKRYTTRLRAGSYSDDAAGGPTGPGDAGVWSISPPLAYPVHLAGSGRVTLDLASAPNANVVVDVYDLDRTGKGPLVTRQAHLIRQSGRLALDLWSADWKVPAGHRIGVRVTDSNDDFWAHTPPASPSVTLRSGSVSLPFLSYTRPRRTAGNAGVQLAEYLEEKVEVSSSVIAASTVRSFRLPPRQAGLRVGFGRQRYRARGKGRSFLVRCRVGAPEVGSRPCAVTARVGKRVIGKGKRTVARGRRSAIVRVKLTKRGRRMLARRPKRMRARLGVRASDPLGRTAKKSKRAKISRAKKRKRR